MSQQAISTIVKELENLSPQELVEVEDFIEKIQQKYKQKKSNKDDLAKAILDLQKSMKGKVPPEVLNGNLKEIYWKDMEEKYGL